MKANHIEHWDDERNLDNGILVTLKYGYSFHNGQHTGVMGFDTVREAREASKLKNVYRCQCAECVKHTRA